MIYTLQPDNIKTHCNAPLLVAQTHNPQLVPDCEVIRDKFEPMFVLFAHCHNIYDAGSVDSLQDLGREFAFQM